MKVIDEIWIFSGMKRSLQIFFSHNFYFAYKSSANIFHTTIFFNIEIDTIRNQQKQPARVSFEVQTPSKKWWRECLNGKRLKTHLPKLIHKKCTKTDKYINSFMIHFVFSCLQEKSFFFAIFNLYDSIWSHRFAGICFSHTRQHS
jgi:hypothetical protein